MSRLKTNNLSRLKNRVWIVALLAVATTLSAAPRSTAQAMQQGISVHLVTTHNAVPESAADDQGAWIVTVTADGDLYFGTTPVTPESLTEEMTIHPRPRDAKLYVKADARSPFASIEKVLEAARIDFFTRAVLLTSQSGQSEPGAIVPPKGLEVLIGPAPPAGTVATVVELFNSGRHPLTLKINNDQIPWSALQSTLVRHFQNGDEKVILLKADIHLPFSDVARAIDMCRSTGANVVLVNLGT
jgi:biopolymer transport protein ExbD